jgi:hypothetical protein
VPDIGRDDHRAAPEPFDLQHQPGDRLPIVFRARRQRHVGAGLGQADGNRPPDAL